MPQAVTQPVPKIRRLLYKQSFRVRYCTMQKPSPYMVNTFTFASLAYLAQSLKDSLGRTKFGPYLPCSPFTEHPPMPWKTQPPFSTVAFSCAPSIIAGAHARAAAKRHAVRNRSRRIPRLFAVGADNSSTTVQASGDGALPSVRRFHSQRNPCSDGVGQAAI